MIARFSLSEGGMKFIPLILAQFENLGELGVSGFSWLVSFLLSV